MSASLVLLDGSGFLFRAYYGLPELTNEEGQQIHAVYGFLRMVFKILDDHNYTHLLIARDAPVKTLRHIAFEDYKANRTALPDQFKAQIRMTKDLIKELGIPALEIPGYEADDIIGTLATHYAKDPSVEVAIASGDKDLKQLITHNIIHTDPMKQVVTTKESFFDEFGFQPEYLVDYLAIVGDSSDNIPGVPGIGPKGATELISQYHTIENIFTHLEEVSPALREKLREHEETALRSKKLTQLMEVPDLTTLPFADIEIKKIDRDTWVDILLVKHGFISFKKYLDSLRKKAYETVQQSLF